MPRSDRAVAPRFRPSAVPAAALALTLAGLIPFVGLAAATLAGPPDVAGPARDLLAGYGAVILTFMGGCRFGFACAGLGGGPSVLRLGIAVTPALVAWAALALGTGPALWVSAAGLAALFAADVALTRAGGAPEWWPALRWPPTLGATLSLVAAALAGNA